MIRKILKLTSALMAAGFTYFLYSLSFKFPSVVEFVYSNGIYVFLTRTVGRLSAAVPVSLAEILLYIFVLSVIFYVIYIIVAFFKPKGEKLENIGKRFLSFASLLCVLYVIFVCFWGFNYARKPLAQIMDLDTSDGYTTEELKTLTDKLIDECNELRPQLREDSNGVFTLSRTKEEVLESMGDIYERYAPDYINRSPKSKVKGVFTPNLLSHIETLGIYSPFTFECNVNMQMPDLFFPATVAHEYSHLQGFAREDEANFISFYVLSNSEEKDLRYSSYVHALNYALISLRKSDVDAYRKCWDRLDEGVKRDFRYESEYWEPFEDTKISEISDEVYKEYLISNGIPDEKKSYGRMLDLMLALQRKGEL